MGAKRGKTPSLKSTSGEAELGRLVQELELLRGLVHLLPEGVAITEPTGEMVFLNEAMERLCGGVKPATFEELSAMVSGGELTAEIREALARARAATGVFFDDLRRGTRHLTVSSRTMGSEVRGLRLWSFVDRSAESRRGEERHLQAVDLFSTGIAHNFNSLLCGISGAIDVLENIAGDDTRAKRCVGLTRQCVEEGVALTRKMATSSPHAPNAAISAALEDVVKSVVEVQQVLQSGRVAFELAIPPNLPPVGMPWDSLVRVIQNLVVNSVEAIEAVGKVRISAEVAPARDTVAVRIEDTGVGMDEPTLQRVFEPFFSKKNIDAAHGSTTDGSGLGLWNVYRAVRTAGGTVAMKSRPGEGTTVEVVLPVVHEKR
ncbi:MAG: hypothetical protein RL417_1477 [Pseudomonadota bacterium]|jgi:signal transduction histidine kinase